LWLNSSEFNDGHSEIISDAKSSKFESQVRQTESVTFKIGLLLCIQTAAVLQLVPAFASSHYRGTRSHFSLST